mgnify:CR=1 FL=1
MHFEMPPGLQTQVDSSWAARSAASRTSTARCSAGLLAHLLSLPQSAGAQRVRGASVRGRPLLVGTWADAVWAVRFYERHGFRLVTPAEKDRLLRRYWSIPERQVATSVVLRREEDAAG